MSTPGPDDAPMSTDRHPSGVVATKPPRRTEWRALAGPVLGGLLIVAVGVVPWMLLSRINRDVQPDIPWAALATIGYTSVMIAWLHGLGRPRSTSAERRRRLRLWPPDPIRDRSVGALSAGTIVLLLAGLYLL